MPLQKATNSDGLMTQYEMHAIEALGLLKFDFLGLSNLTILRQAVDLVRDNRGIEIDLDAIPLDDATTFELLASGETTGVFQLESAGMRRYVRDLRPTSVYDLAAMVALYRPGPMDNIPAYIRRKHGQEPVTYLHPLLEPYLEKTYGIFVYQEDIMSAAIALGGFTGPEADTLGYAIRKKKSAVLRAQKEKFVTQAAERGVAAERHRRRLQGLRAVRALRLQQGARHVLRADRLPDRLPEGELHGRLHDRGADRVPLERGEGRRGRRRVPPDGHRGPAARRPQSHLEFTVEGDAIRFGLLAVKNVGQGAIESIIAARDEGGEFRSLTDFCTRIDLRLANRKVLEALAKVGALSPFGHPAQILLGLDDAVAAARRPSATGSPARPRCSTSAPPRRRPSSGRSRHATEVPVRERLRWEKELLGLYLSEHPMGEVAERVGRFVTAYSSDLRDESLDGQRVVVGGIVTGVRVVITKAKSTMAIVTLEDLQGTIEVVVFPRLYEQTDGHVARRARSCSSPAASTTRARRSRCWPTSRSSGMPRRPGARRASRGRSRRATVAVAAGDRTARTAPGRVGDTATRRARDRSRRAAVRSSRSVPASRSGSRPAVAAAVPASAVRRRASRRSRSSRRVGPAPPRSRAPRSRRRSRRSRRPSRSRPTPTRRASRRDPTRTTSRRSRTRRAPGSWPTPRPTPRSMPARRRSSTSGSRGRRRPIASSGRWRRSRRSCATDRARRGSSSTSRRRPAARRCRWSCAAASPTTPSCWPRSAAGSATA